MRNYKQKDHKKKNVAGYELKIGAGVMKKNIKTRNELGMDDKKLKIKVEENGNELGNTIFLSTSTECKAIKYFLQVIFAR